MCRESHKYLAFMKTYSTLKVGRQGNPTLCCLYPNQIRNTDSWIILTRRYFLLGTIRNKYGRKTILKIQSTISMQQKWIHLWSLTYKLDVIIETKWSTLVISSYPNCMNMVIKWTVNTRTFSMLDLWAVSICTMASHGKWRWIQDDRWPTEHQSKHSCSSNQEV